MSDPRMEVLSPPVARDDKVMPAVVYGLYLFGLANGITILIGLVIAYAMKRDAGERACSHYIFQIRTFWLGIAWAALGLALIVLGVPLTLILFGLIFIWIGWSILGLIGLWIVVRCVLGLVYLGREEAYPRPRAWLF